MVGFEDIPADVLQHEIFPFLDYCERNKLNQTLPFKERVRVPLKKDITISMIMNLQSERTRRLLNATKTHDPEKKWAVILKIFSSFDSMSYMLQHNAKFRAVTLEKCARYSNINDEEYRETPEEFKEAMQDICQEALIQIPIKYPYKYEVHSIKPADTSPAIQNRYVMKELWAKRAEARRIRLSYNSL